MQFYKKYWAYFIISAVFLIPGLFSLIKFGFNPGIDFTGGSLLIIEAQEATQAVQLTENNIRQITTEELMPSSIKQAANGQVIMRLMPISNEQKNQLLNQINQLAPVKQISFDSVGATMGKELIQKTLIAIALASVILVIYLKVRFQDLSFGLAAFLGVVHDVLIICGIFSILGIWLKVEVDTLFVTALLTTVSFSVHDTVVIYDRIREIRKQNPKQKLTEIANLAVVATISRSLNNSLAVAIMLLALLMLGGVTLRYFALALLLGVFFGTYSSPFTSVPLLLLFEDLKKKSFGSHIQGKK